MSDEPLNNEQIEPSGALPINTMDSEPSNMPLEASEAPINADIPVSLNNPNPENTPISTPNPEEPKPEVLSAEGGKTEEILEPVQTPEIRTAQIPVNEPLASEPEVKPEPLKTEPETFSQPKISLARELLVKARNMIQFRKRKKLDRVMTLFLKKSKITNDEVRDFLHVSDATATRYLSQLEKEGKIKQNGKTGHAVSYSRI
jgi:hypothetical protein